MSTDPVGPRWSRGRVWLTRARTTTSSNSLRTSSGACALPNTKAKASSVSDALRKGIRRRTIASKTGCRPSLRVRSIFKTIPRRRPSEDIHSRRLSLLDKRLSSKARSTQRWTPGAQRGRRSVTSITHEASRRGQPWLPRSPCDATSSRTWNTSGVSSTWARTDRMTLQPLRQAKAMRLRSQLTKNPATARRAGSWKAGGGAMSLSANSIPPTWPSASCKLHRSCG
mmetsp:Transcript_30276/g.80158  ORF Transcript_30276/g.80158 Transcript_30276/m.80158 type:complete len:226 (+) Transcript_30276:269-946(+)